MPGVRRRAARPGLVTRVSASAADVAQQRITAHFAQFATQPSASRVVDHFNPHPATPTICFARSRSVLRISQERASPVPGARKSLDQRLADLTERRQQLEARRLALLASKKSADRKLDTRRKIIVGAAVLAHAELNPDFSTMLREILSVAVQRDLDRRVIADLLDPSSPDDSAASQPALNQQQVEP